MAGKPGGRNAGMPEVQRLFEHPSLQASKPQAYLWATKSANRPGIRTNIFTKEKY
jgi:hypothetical protein